LRREADRVRRRAETNISGGVWTDFRRSAYNGRQWARLTRNDPMKPQPFRFPALTVILASMVGVTPATADCLSECFASMQCDVRNQTQCDFERRTCSLKCMRERTVSFGAIAYGEKSHAFGYSFNQGDAARAERTALANCRKNGDDCKIVSIFSNACAAVASGASNRFAAAEAKTREQAQAEALAACGHSAGGKCEIEVWSCSFP
jgi:hypothetical protein